MDDPPVMSPMPMYPPDPSPDEQAAYIGAVQTYFGLKGFPPNTPVPPIAQPGIPWWQMFLDWIAVSVPPPGPILP